MSTLGKAIALAAESHKDQKDKAGKAYILHPLRMMMRLKTNDEELMIIAILHDVVEDDPMVDLSTLRFMGFSERVVHGVDGVTRRDNESYDDFIIRCAKNPASKKIKLEDLRDNSDITRLKGIGKRDIERMEKYHKAWVYLSK